MAEVRLSPDHFVKPPSYIIFEKEKVYKVLNCLTQEIEFSGMEAAEIIQKAIDALPKEGGRIFIKGGDYTLNSPLIFKKPVQIFEGGAQIATRLIANAEMDYMLDFSEAETGILHANNDIRNIELNLNGKARGGINLARTAGSIQHFLSRVWIHTPNTVGTLEGVNLDGCEDSTLLHCIINMGTYGKGVRWYVPGGLLRMFANFIGADTALDLEAQVAHIMGANVIYGSSANIYFNAIHFVALISGAYLVNDGTGYVINTHATNRIRLLKLVGCLIAGKASQTLINVPTTTGNRVCVECCHFHSDDGTTLTAFNIPNLLCVPKSNTYETVTKGTYNVPDAGEIKVPLIRAPNADIDGNAGTAYADFLGTAFIFDTYRVKPDKIRFARWYIVWDPKTTVGGIRLYNATDAEEVASLVPGVAGWRTDTVDITTYLKGLPAGEKWIYVHTKGDGTTPPTIRQSFIRIVLTEEEP